MAAHAHNLRSDWRRGLTDRCLTLADGDGWEALWLAVEATRIVEAAQAERRREREADRQRALQA